MSKVYTFEVVPRYTTRKLTDKVLFPDGYAYEKQMPVRQAVALFNTCNAIHVKHADKWYPVLPDTIDAALANIDANKAPAVTEVPQANRSIASYVVAPNPETVVHAGKKAEQFGNVRIENGMVIGELYMIKNFTEFNASDVNEQNGYYLPLGWTTNTKYLTPKMTVVNGKNKPVGMDPANLIFLGGADIAFKKIIKVTAVVDGKEVEMVVHLGKVICVDNTVPDYHVGGAPTPPPAPPVVVPPVVSGGTVTKPVENTEPVPVGDEPVNPKATDAVG